jgi:type I restriction enzyme S subunit
MIEVETMKKRIKYEISEIGEVIGGATPSTKDEDNYGGDIPWITPKDLSSFKERYIYRGERNISEKGLNSCSAKLMPKNTVLFSSRAPIGYVAIAANELCTNQGFKSIIADETKINFLYLYYYLIYKKGEIEAVASGTTFKEVSGSVLKKFNIEIPESILEQKAIAATLSCLDDMIELNNRTNQILEEIAQAIFKHWFIDFEFPNEEGEPYKSSGGEMVDSELGEIPKGWRVAKLEDALLVIEAGNRPKGGASNLDNGIPSIGAENIIGLGEYDFSKEKYVPEEYFELMNKGIVNNWDVMLYKDGAQIGRKTMFAQDFPHKKCCINSHVFILRCNDLITQPYLYFWLDQDYMTQNIINLNANSAQPGINQPAVKQLKILVPDKETINRFQDIVEKLLILLFENCKENRKLTSLRDTLLPKLMSGEIRVPTEEVV